MTTLEVQSDGRIFAVKDCPEKPRRPPETIETYAGTMHLGGDFGYEKTVRKYQQALASCERILCASKRNQWAISRQVEKHNEALKDLALQLKNKFESITRNSDNK